VTERPACHPATLVEIYVYGYLNRLQSSRRLERECQRNIELVLAHRPPDAGFYDDSRFPQRQRRGYPQGLL
jgi:hypothetical protein